ncbi:hypothetical protein ACFQE8_03990 [Salinirubellus sp. GCM10025818]|uniref:hypothetical protein n=1 Tax=Salinirubellus TaxID=2162630 RepID=UPI0030CF8E4D
MNGTGDENEFRHRGTGRVDVVVIAGRVRRRVVVGVTGGGSVVVWMDVPAQIPIRPVAIVNLVVALYRPPDGDGRRRSLADAVLEVESQFTGAQRIVQ